MAETLLVGLGREAEADRYMAMGIKRAEEAMRLHPENGKPAQMGAPSLARIGEAQRAMDWLERSLYLDPDDPLANYNAACTFAHLGEVDRAFETLERWGAVSGKSEIAWLEKDSDLDSLRTDPRFASLKDQLGQRSRVGSQ